MIRLNPIVLTSFLVLVMVLCSSLARSQSTSDDGAIRKAVENYIVGWRTADSTLLATAFDLEAGVVLWVDRNSSPEQLNSMKLEKLVSRNKSREDYGIGYRIEELKIIGSQLAIVMVNIPTRKGYYVDCLELQKINDQWKIVLKSFVYFPNG